MTSRKIIMFYIIVQKMYKISINYKRPKVQVELKQKLQVTQANPSSLLQRI